MKSKLGGGVALMFGAVMSAQAAGTASVPVVGNMLQPVLGSLAVPGVSGSLPALSVPGLGTLPGLGALPSLGTLPGLGSIPTSASLPGLGSLPALPVDTSVLTGLMNGGSATTAINQFTQTTASLYPVLYSVSSPVSSTVLSQPQIASIAPTALGIFQDQIGAQVPGVLTNVITPGFGTVVSPVLGGYVVPAAISFANYVPQVRQVLAITPVLTPAGLPALVALVVP